jgi:hypothetical protein
VGVVKPAESGRLAERGRPDIGRFAERGRPAESGRCTSSEPTLLAELPRRALLDELLRRGKSSGDVNGSDIGRRALSIHTPRQLKRPASSLATMCPPAPIISWIYCSLDLGSVTVIVAGNFSSIFFS